MIIQWFNVLKEYLWFGRDLKFGEDNVSDISAGFSKVVGIPYFTSNDTGRIILPCRQRRKVFIIYDDGSAYIGDAYAQKRHGSGLFYDCFEESLYFGDWKHDVRHGFGRIVQSRIPLGTDIGGLMHIALMTSNALPSNRNAQLCSLVAKIPFTKSYGVWQHGNLMECFRSEIVNVFSPSSKFTSSMPDVIKWKDVYVEGVLDSSTIVDADVVPSDELEDIQRSTQDHDDQETLDTANDRISWSHATTTDVASFFRSQELHKAASAVQRRGITGSKLLLMLPLNSQQILKEWGIKSFGERTKITRLLQDITTESTLPSRQGSSRTHRGPLNPHASDPISGSVPPSTTQNAIDPNQLRLTHLLPCSRCRDEGELLVFQESEIDRYDNTRELLHQCRNLSPCRCPRYSFKAAWLGTDVCVRIFPGLIQDQAKWNDYITRVMEVRYPHLVLVIGPVTFDPYLHGLVTEWVGYGGLDRYLDLNETPINRWQSNSSFLDKNDEAVTKPSRSRHSGILSPAVFPNASTGENLSQGAHGERHRLNSVLPLLLSRGLIRPVPYSATSDAVETRVGVRGFNDLKVAAIRQQLLRRRGVYAIPLADVGGKNNHVAFECLKSSNLVEFFTNIALTMMYLHQREIPHGSLKPSNILIAECFTPKLDDFGYRYMLHECFSTFPLLRNTLPQDGPQMDDHHRNVVRPHQAMNIYEKCIDCGYTHQVYKECDMEIEDPIRRSNLTLESLILGAPEFHRFMVCLANNVMSHRVLTNGSANGLNYFQEDVYAFGMCLWQCNSGLMLPYYREKMPFTTIVIGLAGGGLPLPPLSCHRSINVLISDCTNQVPHSRLQFPVICRKMRRICDQLRNESVDMVRSFVLGVDSNISDDYNRPTISASMDFGNAHRSRMARSVTNSFWLSSNPNSENGDKRDYVTQGGELRNPNRVIPSAIAAALPPGDEAFHHRREGLRGHLNGSNPSHAGYGLDSRHASSLLALSANGGMIPNARAMDVLKMNTISSRSDHRWSWDLFRSYLMSTNEENQDHCAQAGNAPPAPWSMAGLGPEDHRSFHS